MADKIKLVIAAALLVARASRASTCSRRSAVDAAARGRCSRASPRASRWPGSPRPASSSSRSRRESLVEAKKVVWPTRKETLQTTGVVFAFVVVMAVFLWVSDKTLEWVLYDLILGWKKT